MALGLGRAAMIGGALGVAGVMGAASRIGPSVREGAMEAALGDPNADAAFLGKNVSARFLIGSAVGGPLGDVMQLSAPQDKFMVDPARGVGFAAGLAGVGAAVGGGLGYRSN